MDGLEATRRIRALEQDLALPRMPIIAVTANAYKEDRERCLEAGMDDYLSKPFSEDDLAAALRRWAPRTLAA
jgi:CheY-like chemotaxis protein